MPVMRLNLALGIIGLCLVSPGCRLAMLISEDLAFERALWRDERDSERLYRQLADAAWGDFQVAHAPQGYSADFVHGFQEGFVDHLAAGGTGHPPPLPPQHYWTAHYQSPEGHQAIEDWFAGFRQGAAAAQASGYRQWVTVPVAVPGPHGPHGPPAPHQPPANGIITEA